MDHWLEAKVVSLVTSRDTSQYILAKLCMHIIINIVWKVVPFILATKLYQHAWQHFGLLFTDHRKPVPMTVVIPVQSSN